MTSHFKDIIVAVHGIDEQSRFSTVRSVATRLAGSATLLGKSQVRPVSAQPPGYFHSDVEEIASVRPLDDADNLKGSELASIGLTHYRMCHLVDRIAPPGIIAPLDEPQWPITVHDERRLCSAAGCHCSTACF
jgi:hypothetical protein